jgi:hypothetical protein
MDTDSNPIISQFIGTENQREPFAMPTRSLPVYLIKLPALTKQGCFREFKSRQRYLSGETLTPFSTTSIQNCTTGTSRHPGTKSMGTFTLDITGLKSTFTHYLLLVRVYCGLITLKTGTFIHLQRFTVIPGYFCPAQPVH